MIYDEMTAWFIVWAAATAVVCIAMTVCNGCCIAKLLGKPCKPK